MKTRLLLLLCCFVLVSGTVAAEFKAGVAVRVVTPEPLLPVSGGVGPGRPTTQKLGDLTVRALVLQDDDTRVAIVGADFLGFPAALGNRVRAMVPDIPAENILIGVTHTHSAPDCYAFPDGTGGTSADLDYLDTVCRKMADAINEASRKAERANLKIATGEAKGKIAYNYYAEQLYDPRCHVIQAIGDDGKPIATLVNYATHPEILGPGQGILSPDLCGPLYDRIEAKGGGTAIFMNSAQGGMVTADCRGEDGEDIQTWEECIRIGELLADEALRIVADAPVQADPDLYCAATSMTFPVTSELLRMLVKTSPLLAGSLNDDGTVSGQVNVVNVGNAQILTIPGEALPNIGYYLKRNMHGEHNLLFGLTNDAFGYMMVKEDWGSFKRYEYISRTGLGEMTGDIFVEEALKFVNQCPKPQPLR
jgi:hypothetical protein